MYKIFPIFSFVCFLLYSNYYRSYSALSYLGEIAAFNEMISRAVFQMSKIQECTNGMSVSYIYINLEDLYMSILNRSAVSFLIDSTNRGFHI